MSKHPEQETVITRYGGLRIDPMTMTLWKQ